MRAGILQQGFENYIKLAFPTVEVGSNQYKVMELVWHTSVFAALSAVLAPDVTVERAADMSCVLLKESEAYCEKFIKQQWGSLPIGATTTLQ